MDAVNLDFPEETPIFLIHPSFREGIFETVNEHDVRLEIRFHRADGEITFFTQRFGRYGNAIITNDFVRVNLGTDLPETLKISVQAVDISGALPNPDDFLPPADRSNDGSIAPQSTTEPVYPIFQEGLYKIESDANFRASDFNFHCNMNSGAIEQTFPIGLT
jgi:hypothetical protein